MEIELDINKTVEQNAEEYYKKVKKAKKKLEGVKGALIKLEKKLNKAKEEKDKQEKDKKKTIKEKRKKKWYEKFRWFITSTGFLVIGGRDATTNEIIIKKHTEKEDIVFHSEMSGSPFTVIKTKGEKVDKETIKEAATFTASYSKAWKTGLGNMDIFYVTPKQVSKTAQSGEYMQKGSFMIYGKKTIMNTILETSIGIMEDNSIMGGPSSAIKKNTLKSVEIEQGNEKTSQVAKSIQRLIGGTDLDDIISVIPPGSRLKKQR